MSSRDFVRNILPQIQSRSPQLLNHTAEAVLEHEIDNENATVVRGDGVETASGMQEVKEELGEEERTESESDDDSRAALRAYPSWGRAQIWSPSPPTSDDEDDEDEEPSASETPIPTPTLSRPRADTLPSMSGLRRIQSAISVIIPDPISPTPRHHQRTQSHRPRRPDPRRSPGLEFRRPANHIRLPTFSISSINSPPPSPSIRRSNASHPDITSLVENWTHSGPANQTLMYKPHQYFKRS